MIVARGTALNGERLRQLRLGKGWSQVELARKASVPSSTISRAEALGRRGADLKTVSALADALSVPITELMAAAGDTGGRPGVAATQGVNGGRDDLVPSERRVRWLPIFGAVPEIETVSLRYEELDKPVSGDWRRIHDRCILLHVQEDLPGGIAQRGEYLVVDIDDPVYDQGYAVLNWQGYRTVRFIRMAGQIVYVTDPETGEEQVAGARRDIKIHGRALWVAPTGGRPLPDHP